MKMKLLAGLCLITMLCKGQSNAWFEIGKPSPDFTLNEVVNYPKRKVSLKDFSGKWAVLYFWNSDICVSTWCTDNFIALDKLSEKFGAKIQFIMIGYTGFQYSSSNRLANGMDQVIRQTYDGAKNEMPHLPMAYDSLLFHRADIAACPFIVMIDPKGIVRSVTSAITANDITAVMKGQKASSPYAYRTREPGSAPEYYSHETYLEVGKHFWDITFKNVNYFPKTSVSRNDFPGKWLIIDCWDRFCSSCVRSFPHIDSMQRLYGDKAQFLLLGLTKEYPAVHKTDPDKTEEYLIRELYEKVRAKENLALPVVFDSVFFQRNDIDRCPYIIVVDPKGIVRSITSQLTQQNLLDFFEGRDPGPFHKVYRSHEKGNPYFKMAATVETIPGHREY